MNVLKGNFIVSAPLANISEVAVSKAERGVILDRYGKPLVKNKPIFNAVLVPSQLPKEAIEKKAAITKIAKILELEPEIIQKFLKKPIWNLLIEFYWFGICLKIKLWFLKARI